MSAEKDVLGGKHEGKLETKAEAKQEHSPSPQAFFL